MSDTLLETKSKEKLSSLRFLRIFDPCHIPRYLIEQVKHRDYTVDEWFDHQKAICVWKSGENFELNPYNLLYAISDDENIVKGVLWATADPLSKCLCIQTYSLDPEYWNSGECVDMLEEKAKEIRDSCKMRKIYWITNYPRHSKRHGFKPSKAVLMEYKENSHGKNTDGRQYDIQPTVSSTGTVSKQPNRSTGTKCTVSTGGPDKWNGPQPDGTDLPEDLCRPSDAELRAKRTPIYQAEFC